MDDTLPMFLHMEFQQPDDRTGDAAATTAPDQAWRSGGAVSVNVYGLPLCDLGSRNLKLSLVVFRVCHFPCPALPFMVRYFHRWFRGGTGTDRRLLVSPIPLVFGFILNSLVNRWIIKINIKQIFGLVKKIFSSLFMWYGNVTKHKIMVHFIE